MGAPICWSRVNGVDNISTLPQSQTVHTPHHGMPLPWSPSSGEGNYSDAHLFPLAYKLKNIGKTVGMPIPGTGTFVWWENQIDATLVFGIPMGGCDARWQVREPDIRVRNDPDIMTGARDETE